MAVAFVGKGLSMVAAVAPTATVTPTAYLGTPPDAPSNVTVTVQNSG